MSKKYFEEQCAELEYQGYMPEEYEPHRQYGTCIKGMTLEQLNTQMRELERRLQHNQRSAGNPSDGARLAEIGAKVADYSDNKAGDGDD